MYVDRPQRENSARTQHTTYETLFCIGGGIYEM